MAISDATFSWARFCSCRPIPYVVQQYDRPSRLQLTTYVSCLLLDSLLSGTFKDNIQNCCTPMHNLVFLFWGPCTNYITLKGWGGPWRFRYIRDLGVGSCVIYNASQLRMPSSVAVWVLTMSWISIVRLDILTLVRTVEPYLHQRNNYYL